METMNKLPLRMYVRQRVSTIVSDIAGLSSGTVTLNLAAPSDVTVIIVADPGGEPPAIFVAATGRTPTLSDFDVVAGPASNDYVKPPNRVTLHLPAMQSSLCWAAFDLDGVAAAFGETGVSRLVVAIDQ
jgi:hypothetical protein